MRTEIKLNDVYYKTLRLPTQTLANQMASKMAQGTSEYGDLTTWSAWIQQDWQEGVGKIKPHLNGGFSYGELESRVPGQLILPSTQADYRQLISDNSGGRFSWNLSPWAAGATARGTYALANNNYLAWQVNLNSAAGTRTGSVGPVAIYGEAAAGTVLRCDIYSSSSDLPNATLANGSVTASTDFPGPQWHFIPVSYSPLVEGTEYFIVIRPTTGSITLYGIGTDLLSVIASSTNGSAWSDVTTFYPFWVGGGLLTSDTVATAGPLSAVAAVYSTHARGFAVVGAPSLTAGTATALYTWTQGASYISYVNSYGSVAPTSAAVFNDLIYIARGSGNNIVSFALDLTGAGTLGAVDADLLLSSGGYLWRSLGNDLYYTDDVVTWTTVGPVCSGPYAIRGMAMMGGDMYIACDDGLYWNAPGDFIRGVLPWSPSSTNGRGMVNFQGALYITVNGRVIRYTQDGSSQDVWISRDDDLPASRLGTVTNLLATDSWLIALVTSSSNQSSVWALQDNSWHHLGTFPYISGSFLYYQRSAEMLWMISSVGNMANIRLSATARNPYHDTSSFYMPAAWIEWDWFDGQILEADKDYDSVTIIGENFSSGQTAKVYWKDDASTAWELLGTVDSNFEELRWTLGGGTRPNTKRFKLGMLLSTSTFSETPRVQAIRVKYHLMVKDWFRWNVTIDVSGKAGAYQMTGNGTRNNLTQTQIKDNIAALATRVPPFVYQDVDGNQYEVKITEATFQYTNYEYNESTSHEKWEGNWNLVLEQVTSGEYSA
jgi:hypothetical protein